MSYSSVRLIGLEPTQLALLDPKSSASTNFATGACGGVCGSSKNCGCKGSVFFLNMPINRCFFVCFSKKCAFGVVFARDVASNI